MEAAEELLDGLGFNWKLDVWDLVYKVFFRIVSRWYWF